MIETHQSHDPYILVHKSCRSAGFAAVDLTVMCMTEVMWSFVLLDTDLLDVVLHYSIKFLLAPVSYLTP